MSREQFERRYDISLDNKSDSSLDRYLSPSDLNRSSFRSTVTGNDSSQSQDSCISSRFNNSSQNSKSFSKTQNYNDDNSSSSFKSRNTTINCSQDSNENNRSRRESNYNYEGREFSTLTTLKEDRGYPFLSTSTPFYQKENRSRSQSRSRNQECSEVSHESINL